MIILKNVKNLLQNKKSQETIETRLQEIERRVSKSGKKEVMPGTSHNKQKVYQGVVGEFLVGNELKKLYGNNLKTSECNDTTDFFLYGKKIDVKTIFTKSTTNLSNIENILHYSIYIQEKQLQENINYCMCWYNSLTGDSIIVLSNKLRGHNIQKSFTAKLCKPENTTGSEETMNFKVPVRAFYKD